MKVWVGVLGVAPRAPLKYRRIAVGAAIAATLPPLRIAPMRSPAVTGRLVVIAVPLSDVAGALSWVADHASPSGCATNSVTPAALAMRRHAVIVPSAGAWSTAPGAAIDPKMYEHAGWPIEQTAEEVDAVSVGGPSRTLTACAGATAVRPATTATAMVVSHLVRPAM